MPKINDGGPAFPRPIGEARGLHHQNVNTEQDGMSLRDYFAAHAPAVPGWWRQNTLDEAANMISWAWAYADAMIEARERMS